MLLSAAAIFGFMAYSAKKAFALRVANIVPRNVVSDHLNILLREFPQHHSEFRSRALPLYAAHLALNTMACGVVLVAAWTFPTGIMSDFDLLVLRWGGLVIVPIAFVMDSVGFFRVLARSFVRQRADAQ